ncbi:hypothetical protein ET532_024640 [Verminephrobacter sp. Larva24]|nr:hypothetical protein ET532_024640 [Verminephrobacter sp. Larva24]
MATPVKTAQGTWRIQIEVKGLRDSATLPPARGGAWTLDIRTGQALIARAAIPGQRPPGQLDDGWRAEARSDPCHAIAPCAPRWPGRPV